MTNDPNRVELAGLQAKIAAGLACIGDQLALVSGVTRQGGSGGQERRDLWQMERDQAALGRERSTIIERIELAGGQLVVLVVDDEALLLMSTADELRGEGFAVIEASSADAAIGSLTADASIDAMFTDVQMPGSMNGLELAARVHRNWPSVKVLVTSGNSSLGPGDVARGDSFFGKPYSISEIATALRN
jgi:CheY-like chemotaxis protein